MYLDTTPEFERTLLPVRIPVDKSLVGYRVFLIRREDQERFDAVRSLDDLRKFTFGLGLGWVDVGILRANGFRVVTGSSYEGLFEMLANARFDVFSRGADEVLDELGTRRQRIPELALEPGIVLYYPLPMYFWFSRTDEGGRLAARAREGMMAMIDDGTYDRIFMKYHAQEISALKLRSRRIFRLGESQPRARDAPRGRAAVVPPLSGGPLPPARTASIAVLFVALLIPVVTIVLAGFGAFDYVTESRREWADLRLKAVRLGDELSVGLALPVWNFDHDQILGVLSSAMTRGRGGLRPGSQARRPQRHPPRDGA